MNISKAFLQMLVGGLGCFALFAGSGQSAAHGQQTQQQQSHKDVGDDASSAEAKTLFSSRDLETIRIYYKKLFSKVAPGYAGNVPPELQLHVERDSKLPPRLQRRLTPFPKDLADRLPRLPANYVRGSINADILIVDARTQRIVDIVHQFLRP